MNLPDKKYKVILADPPWQYDDAGCSGCAADQYTTMDNDEICALPVWNIAAEDAVLFLWATYPKLKEAFDVIAAWGFTYKSIAFQWIKKNRNGIGNFYGLGRWTRGHTEPCLLATQGKPARINSSVFQIIQTPIRQHSQKPDEQYVKIEKLMGDLPRIELFARNRRVGWDSWGKERSDTVQQVLRGVKFA